MRWVYFTYHLALVPVLLTIDVCLASANRLLSSLSFYFHTRSPSNYLLEVVVTNHAASATQEEGLRGGSAWSTWSVSQSNRWSDVMQVNCSKTDSSPPLINRAVSPQQLLAFIISPNQPSVAYLPTYLSCCTSLIFSNTQ